MGRIAPSPLVRRSRGGSPSVRVVLAGASFAMVVAALPAQRQFDELRGGALPADGDPTSAVALVDVDGDGDLDAVVGKGGAPYSAQNRLYLNDGTGVFTDVTATHMPADLDEYSAFAFGDVDADGDPDLVVANRMLASGRQNRLYRNDGTGRYTDDTAASMPADAEFTTSVALGDVDGDGDLDIVFGNAGLGMDRQNRLYLNDGAGRFADATGTHMPAYGDSTRAVALGDVDGDGDLDVVFGNEDYPAPEANRLYVNDGSGVFSPAPSHRWPVDQDSTAAVALGDVDGDGDLDVVFGNRPPFGSGPPQPNRLYLNNGLGSFIDITATQLPWVSGGTLAVVLHDLDGDGDLDIVFGGMYSQSHVLVNDGSGIYADSTAARMPSAVLVSNSLGVGDIDGDGDPDLLAGTSDQDRLYLNDGTGRFLDATRTGLPGSSLPVGPLAFGDVDGDGDLDLVLVAHHVVNWTHLRLLQYRNDGRGEFEDVSATRMPPRHWSGLDDLVLGDVDGDGDLDIVGGGGGLSNVVLSLLRNDGGGDFSDPNTGGTWLLGDGSVRALALGDIDGDGDLDVVHANGGRAGWPAQDLSSIRLNDGSGDFSAVGRFLPRSTLATDVALGDVDLDGDLDVLFAWSPCRLYANDGTGTLTDVTAARMPAVPSATAVALGDVDGDGDIDAVFGTDARDRLQLNDGSGNFTDATATHMPGVRAAAAVVELADVDGDGDLDVVTTNGQAPQNRLYLNDGSGHFADVSARLPAEVEPVDRVALGDVDGDGDLDIALGGADHECRLYLDLQRQLDAPYLLRTGRDYTLDVFARYAAPGAVHLALPFVSAGTASIPLPPVGTVGIDPATTVPLSPLFVPQPAGVGSVRVPVPNHPSLVGAAVYAQAVIVPYPFDARLTNVTADVVIR